MDDRRRLFIKRTQVFGMLRDAAKFTKMPGKRGSAQKDLVSTLEVLGDERIFLGAGDNQEPLIVPPDEEIDAGMHDDHGLLIYRDISGVVNPATRGRNVRYRIAARPGWRLAFAVIFDATKISGDMMKAILLDAGTSVGIGDGRSIGMGRFRVVQSRID